MHKHGGSITFHKCMSKIAASSRLLANGTRRKSFVLAGVVAVLLVGVSNSHAAPVLNTATETVSPFLSNGTPGTFSNMSQSKTGFVGVGGSGDDGQGDSGSALAEADYGSIKISGQFQGHGFAVANATFADNVTFTAPGVALGTFGTFNCKISVGGTLSATPSTPAVFDDAAWTLSAKINEQNGNPLNNSTLTAGATLGPNGLTGNPFGVFTDSVTFEFGVPFLLLVSLDGGAEGSMGGQSASADLSHSLYWAGISGVTINGQPVTNFSVSSDSGTNWAQSFVPVPEPSSVALLTVLGSLLFAWRFFHFWKGLRPVGL